MPVFPPHGPIHDETEFWYDTKEDALLYEVNIVGGYDRVHADHDRAQERGYIWEQERFHHYHYQPHGICLLSKVMSESRRQATRSNIELLIRLWLQVESNEQPRASRRSMPPLLPVAKPLAIFLDAKQAEMYKDESLTQGLALLQSYITAKATPPCHSPTS